MSARQRLTFAVVAALIAVVAVVVLSRPGGSGDPSEPSERAGQATPAATATAEAAGGQVPDEAEPGPAPEAEPRVERIRIRGGEPVGGEKRLTVEEGERIRFVVVSDVTDHVHLHGYDVMRDVGPGRNARFDVRADITGVFEAELEDRGVPIATVRVEP